MKIKCNREEFDLNNNDVIFYNGACYQLTTRIVRKGWSEYYPVVSKVLAKKLIKNGNLVLVNQNLEYTTADGMEMWHRYYKIKE
jgi:hypothetical protein